jgi:hypothetical protein
MSEDNSSSIVNGSHLQESHLNSNKHIQSSTTSDSFYVRSHFRNRSKSVALTSTKPSIAQHLMDPATFKLVLDTQKQNLADAKERRKGNNSSLLHKNEWKHFFSTKKKKRRGKARFVWEVKKIKQHKAEMDFIKSIHNLKIPMDTDRYDRSETKKAIVADSYVNSPPDTTGDSYVNSPPDSTVKTHMDVDSDLDSEPEGDDTMTIASLMNGTNSNIDSPKRNYDVQQTQTESPTQLFRDLDESDDDEFLFEE